MKKKVNVFWFRRDLRLEDNIGLHHCLRDNFPVVPIFIFDTTILGKLKDPQDRRVNFLHKILESIQIDLRKLNSDLDFYHGTPKECWKEVINKYDIQNVYLNEDYEPAAIKRDKKVSSLLQKQDITLKVYKDQCIFAKNDVLKKDNTPYTVYTAYKNKWLAQLSPSDIVSANNKKFFKNFANIKTSLIPPLNSLGFEEIKGIKLKKTLNKEIIEKYHLQRDIPALDATTKVAPHLRFGTISPRKCVQIARELNHTWLEELIWREFFMQILYHFPHVLKGPFKQKYQRIKWRNNKKQFDRWCKGETGFPLVDAGMRELNATGHMHNRVRMVAASFLVKDLLIDWRWGEKYFAQKLLDYELSSNNGNWQWVAGTGCDSAPYFRIFNPDTQLKKFDPEYKYVKKWIAEFGTEAYPEKMIDHNMAYHRALRVIKEGING